MLIKNYLLLTFLMLSFLFLACESASENGKAPAKDDTDKTDTETGSVTDTDNPSDTTPYTAPEDVPSVPVCMDICKTVADCVPFGAPPLEKAENFQCRSDGVCIHLGCTNDSQCDDAYPNQNYKCSDKGECLRPCTVPQDCVRFESPTSNADNYKCSDGMCNYLGCLTTSECVAENGTNYVCDDTYHTGIKQCSAQCSADGSVEACVTDHDDEALDSDNFDCISKFCFFTGCNNDDECGEGRKCVKL
jgi:hypothetical protein